MAATGTISIVMDAIGYDPLAKGYVSSLARPTGKRTLTGIYTLSIEAIKKRLQLFKDAFPDKHAAFGFWDFDARRGLAGGGGRSPFARHRALLASEKAFATRLTITSARLHNAGLRK